MGCFLFLTWLLAVDLLRHLETLNKKYTTMGVFFILTWLRSVDLNHRPSGYEPDELPDCSTPRRTGLII